MCFKISFSGIHIDAHQHKGETGLMLSMCVVFLLTYFCFVFYVFLTLCKVYMCILVNWLLCVVVCPQTETTVYTDEFFERQDICVNALDNLEARRYMDR